MHGSLFGGRLVFHVRLRKTLLVRGAFGIILALGVIRVDAHVFVSQARRVGASPAYDGKAWFVEAFVDVPAYDLAHWATLERCMSGPHQEYAPGCYGGDLDDDGGPAFVDDDVDLRDIARFQTDYRDFHLIRAQRLILGQTADFTFRTEWIDFPPGPVDSGLDSSFQTVGDFLGDLPFDVSDPEMLDAPFGNLFLRFTGFIKVQISDEVRVRDVIGFPVWIEVGTMGYDGYQVDVGETAYRFPNVAWAQPFFHWGPSVELVGLFPIEITYVNIYDPNAELGNERAGIEIYSWHGGGLPWPAGFQMLHERFGPGTLLPPRVIYQAEDILPLRRGDFDADADIDLHDLRWYAICADPNFFFLPAGCDWLDMNQDGRVRPDDYSQMIDGLTGPTIPEP